MLTSPNDNETAVHGCFLKVVLLTLKMPKLENNAQIAIITVECKEVTFSCPLLCKTNRFHFGVRLFCYK